MSGERRNAAEVHEFVRQLHEHRRIVIGWTELFRLINDLRPTNALIVAIPEFVEALYRNFSDQVVRNLCVGADELQLYV